MGESSTKNMRTLQDKGKGVAYMDFYWGGAWLGDIDGVVFYESMGLGNLWCTLEGKAGNLPWIKENES